jgi:hypothetical protein
LIYALEANGRTIALTNNKNNLDRVCADPDFSTAEIRWATPAEAARFRTMQGSRARWLGWMAWLWPAAPC